MKKIVLFSLLLLGCILQSHNSSEDDMDTDSGYEERQRTESDGKNKMDANGHNKERKRIENEFKQEYFAFAGLTSMNETEERSPWTWPELDGATTKELEKVCVEAAGNKFSEKSDKYVAKKAEKVDDYHLRPSIEKSGQQVTNSQEKVRVIALYCHVSGKDKEDVEQVFFLVKCGYVLKPVKKDDDEANKMLFIISKLNSRMSPRTSSILALPNFPEDLKHAEDTQRGYELEFKQRYLEERNYHWRWPELLVYTLEEKKKLCIAGAETVSRNWIETEVSEAKEVLYRSFLMFCFGANGEEEWDLKHIVPLDTLYCRVSSPVAEYNTDFHLTRGGYRLKTRHTCHGDMQYIADKVSQDVDADIKRRLGMSQNVVFTPWNQVDVVY